MPPTAASSPANARPRSTIASADSSRSAQRRPSNAPQQGHRVRRARRRRLLLIAGLLFGVVALIAGGLVVWGVVQFNQIERVDVKLDVVKGSVPRNFLIVGSDTRDDLKKGGSDDGAIFGGGEEIPPSGRRADTLILARVDPGNATVEMLSVPRDLWVDIADTGDRGRVNAAYNRGAQALVDTLQDALDVPIHHYVEVDFAGFKGLVDALGGIPMYFDRPVIDRRSGLNIAKSGCRTLDGVQSLAFARSRHLSYNDGTKWVTDPTGDLGRITRHQVFVRHALQKVSKLGLGDLDSMRVLVGVAVNNVTIDANLSTGDMLSLGRKFGSFDPSTMVTHRLETTPYVTSGGAQVVRLDGEGSKPVLEVFRGRAGSTSGKPPTEAPLIPSMVTVDVMNTTSTAGLARAAADQLASGGFTIGDVDNAPLVAETTVRYGKGAERQAELLASKITPRPALRADTVLPTGKVELDLAGPLGKVVPAPAGGAAVDGQPASGGPSTTSVNNPEPTVGVTIGDPPPGIRCG